MLTRKSVVAIRPIKALDRFTPDNIAIKRPGIGKRPSEMAKLLKQVASRDYLEGDVI